MKVHLLGSAGAALGIALLAPGLSAQGYVVEQGEILAATGADVPGLPGATYVSTFDNPVLDTDGNLLFRARFIGPGVTSFNDRALFLADPAGNVSLLVQGSDPAPGLPGLVLASTSSQGIGSGYRISPTGRSMWASRLDGVGVTTSDDSAIFVDTATGFQVLAREGDLVPGPSGAVFGSTFSSLSQQSTGFNSIDRVLFRTSMLGGDVTGSADNDAWFTGTPGALEMMQREGDPVLGTEFIKSLGFVSQMNAFGAVLHDAKLDTALGTATEGNDNTLWLYIPGFGDNLLLREGDPAPGTVGASFGNQSDTWGVSISPNAYDSGGNFILNTDLVGGDVSIQVNDKAMYKGNLGGFTLVVRAGDPAPGTTSLFASFNNSNTSLNNFGTIATQGNLVTTGSGSVPEETGVWINRTGTFELVALGGDPTPGLAGHHFGSFSGQSVYLNDKDQLQITVPVVEDATMATSSSVWTWDPSTGLRLALKAGDQLEISPGNFVSVTSFGGVQFNNGDGAPLSLTHDGRFGLRVNYAGGSAIVAAQIGSMNVEPKELSESAGGTAEMFLDAGAANAGGLYFVLGSTSGSTPGIPFGADTIPLNFDGYFSFTLAHPNTAPLGATFGTLDADGCGTATFTLPAGGFPGPSVAGLEVTHAFAVLNLGGTLDFISEPSAFAILP